MEQKKMNIFTNKNWSRFSVSIFLLLYSYTNSLNPSFKFICYSDPFC